MDGNSVTFNDGGADYNFTIETTGNANMFYIDGGDDRVCIGTNVTGLNLASALGSSSLTVADGILFGTSANTTSYIGTGDTTGDVAIVANATPGNLGSTRTVRIKGGTSGGGGPTEIATFDATVGAIFNPDRASAVDFRIKSVTSNEVFFVNASHDQVQFGTADLVVSKFWFDNLEADNNYAFFGNNATNTASPVMFVNRNGSDGDLIQFRSENNNEGTISVSGSTVALNGFSGRHESSGIPANTPVGTVVSTIDALDVYPDTQLNPQTEKPEANPKAGQTRADHAKVEVSTSEGDACVYGVVAEFTAQDKVIVTSLGIGSVRVTGACSKGDLLESNGDGTAKVQSDDIIRSKTIGKVTIGNSNTGVKLVACVMYCG